MRRRAHNLTDSPVVVDAAGRTLGGGEWADLDQTEQVDAAVAAGRLVLHDLPAPARPAKADSARITSTKES